MSMQHRVQATLTKKHLEVGRKLRPIPFCKKDLQSTRPADSKVAGLKSVNANVKERTVVYSSHLPKASLKSEGKSPGAPTSGMSSMYESKVNDSR